MAIIKKYPAKVVSIQNRIEGVYRVELESIDKPFKYQPGQFLHLALDEYDPAGQWPDSRCFSMQSSPEQEFIKITFAVKGQFTIRMQQELIPGKEVTLKLPYGDLFTQPHSKVNTVLISGGTGITPFLSLFTHCSFSEYINPQIYLGFRSKDHNIYVEDLDRSYNSSGSVKLFYQDTDGILDIQSIFDANGTNCDYFISGPPLMIKTFKQVLIAKGVPPGRVLTDDWE